MLVTHYVIVKLQIETPDDLEADDREEFVDDIINDMDYSFSSSNELEQENLIKDTEIIASHDSDPTIPE